MNTQRSISAGSSGKTTNIASSVHASNASPNEIAARFRRSLSVKKPASDLGSQEPDFNYLEALINAASCSSCAFYEKGACHAMPPTNDLVNNNTDASWPKVKQSQWCGFWREA